MAKTGLKPDSTAMSAPVPRTVYVVDDDAVVRDSLSALLQIRDYTVVEFESARAFLDRVPAGQGGCLMLDMHMPEMTGLELLHKLRKQGDDIATVLITGRNDPTITAQAHDLGVVAVLDKPVAHQTLFAALEKAFS